MNIDFMKNDWFCLLINLMYILLVGVLYRMILRETILQKYPLDTIHNNGLIIQHIPFQI